MKEKLKAEYEQHKLLMEMQSWIKENCKSVISALISTDLQHITMRFDSSFSSRTILTDIEDFVAAFPNKFKSIEHNQEASYVWTKFYIYPYGD